MLLCFGRWSILEGGGPGVETSNIHRVQDDVKLNNESRFLCGFVAFRIFSVCSQGKTLWDTVSNFCGLPWYWDQVLWGEHVARWAELNFHCCGTLRFQPVLVRSGCLPRTPPGTEIDQPVPHSTVSTLNRKTAGQHPWIPVWVKMWRIQGQHNVTRVYANFFPRQVQNLFLFLFRKKFDTMQFCTSYSLPQDEPSCNQTRTTDDQTCRSLDQCQSPANRNVCQYLRKPFQN